MQRSRDPFGGLGHARPGRDQLAAGQHDDAMVAARGNRGQVFQSSGSGTASSSARISMMTSGARAISGSVVACTDSRACRRRRPRRRRPRACRAGSRAAAGVQVPQRARVVPKHEQRARTRPAGHLRADGVERALNRGDELGWRRPCRPRSPSAVIVSGCRRGRRGRSRTAGCRRGSSCCAGRAASVDDDQVRLQRKDAARRRDPAARRRGRAIHLRRLTSKLLTATTRGPAPIANSISVAAGTSGNDAGWPYLRAERRASSDAEAAAGSPRGLEQTRQAIDCGDSPQ